MPTRSYSITKRGNKPFLYKTNGVVGLNGTKTTNHVVKAVAIVSASSGPNWRSRLPRYLTTGNLNVSAYTLHPGVMYEWKWKYRTGASEVDILDCNDYSPPSPPNVPPAAVTAAMTEASRRLLAKYLKTTRAIQGLVNLGETRELLGLMKRSGHAVYNFSMRHVLRTRRKLRRVLPRHRPQAIGDSWLTWSFGIAPLIGDAESLAIAYNKTNRKKFGLKIIRSYANVPTESQPATRFQSDDGHSRRLVYYTRTGSTATVKLMTAIRAEAGHGTFAKEDLQSTLGLTMRDIPGAIWELIPYSFVIDYISNVGEVINSWVYANAFPDGIQKTLITKSFGTQYGMNQSLVPDHTWVKLLSSSLKAKTAVRQQKTISRGLLSSLPVLPFRFENGIGKLQAANLIGLLLAQRRLDRSP